MEIKKEDMKKMMEMIVAMSHGEIILEDGCREIIDTSNKPFWDDEAGLVICLTKSGKHVTWTSQGGDIYGLLKNSSWEYAYN